ncbi:MAG: hypothetical protein JXQ96_02935 [Cyclobacteriaceae bacterium]
MYFSSKLTIDPSQVTKIEKVKPTKAFKRMMYMMTGGAVADKVEIETFAAVSILQQLYRVLVSSGINNIIRLAQDDIDFYLDTEGKEDDLKEALDKHDLEVNDALSEKFGTLHMVLEHHDNNFSYLMDVKVNRSHDVGEYPIEIVINGLLKDMQAAEGETNESIKAKMKSVFVSQEAYDSYVNQKRSIFESFSDTLQMNIKKFMKVDDVRVEHESKIVLPKDKPVNPKGVARNPNAYDPVYHGYYGYDNSFFYGYMWGSMMHDNHVHVHDTYIMNDDGDQVGSIGEEGIDAGDSTIFDPDADYDARMGSDELMENDSSSYDSDGGSWFDGGDDSSSCSSCSSCSGCGGD